MRKHLFLDNDSDTQLALQLYAFIHHNQICDYFENEFRKSTIRRLEQEVAELEIQVRRCDEDIQKLEKDKVSVLARKEKDRVSARAIEEENFKKLNDSITRAKDDARKYWIMQCVLLGHGKTVPNLTKPIIFPLNLTYVCKVKGSISIS